MTRPTILIVDDMPINIQILARALQSTCQIKIATDGAKALEIARSEQRPDLILLDIEMPQMDGYKIIKKLKSNPQTSNIPVIFITIRDDAEDESKGLNMGAVDYITKPFRLPVVRARIKTQLALKRKTDILEEMVSLDGLTNIPNRRRFDEIAKKEWKRAARNGSPLSLAMIDIDWFKNFNDCYGHASGDDCLKAVADKLKNTLERPADSVARYGGEEFAAVLPKTDAHGVKIIAEKIRSDIESLGIPHSASKICNCVTVSVGAATMLAQKNGSVATLIEAADRMLYEAKEGGRNQSCCIDLR